MSSSQPGVQQEETDAAAKPTDETNPPPIVWRTCLSRTGRLYYYNENTGLSQWKKPLEWESDSEELESPKEGGASVEQESSVNASTDSNHPQEANTQDKEKSSTRSLTTPDGSVDREHLASTFVSMALQSKLDLHDPDVLSKAISLLGEESAETFNIVDLNNGDATTASEQHLAEPRGTGSEITLPGKGRCVQSESVDSQQRAIDKPAPSDAPSKQGNLIDQLLVRKPLPTSLLDLDDNLQVPEALRNFMNEESAAFINAALEYLPPDNMLIEADHLCLERQRIDFQLCSSRLKLLHLMQRQHALEAQLMVLKEKVAFGDFVASSRKKLKTEENS